ncbi:MAG TPA: glycosyltransferase family 4 protein [Sedimentisphaerales bacterium]|nr:glycosyltransferase family 4 protein [Sedimentisphaerales bacterium]
MRVLMLGWEFPPFISGGLGTACYGLTRAMDKLGINVTFVLPKMVDEKYTSHVKLLGPQTRIDRRATSSFKFDEFKNVTFKSICSQLKPYDTPEVYSKRIEEILRQKHETYGFETTIRGGEMDGKDYGGDMYTEVHRYAAIVADLALTEDFDVVHAHDWMTYIAGIRVSALTGKPLVVHVHSTEFDRSGEHVNQTIYDIERRGMHFADKVITVSQLTKNIVISRYSVPGEKVQVVHNGVDRENGNGWALAGSGIEKDEKVVLFLGRITMQKGPEYFLHAAKKVLEVMNNVKFVMVGSGDMMHRAVELAAELGIGQKVLFTGFLRGDDVEKIYKMADLYVMPSVSEPFGIAPLEALGYDVPVIISKQSGVSEVLTHALKVDFWDVEEIANKIVAVLRYPPLQMTLRNYGNFEVRRLRWKDSAVKCQEIYNQLVYATV